MRRHTTGPSHRRTRWGHKTEFSYDDKGNLTEVRSKANTGTQPHAIDHDIVTTHVYDSYGNRTQTTVTPKANEQQVVQDGL